MTATVTVDAGAIEASTGRCVAAARPAAVMAVVKADGYGHGMLTAARAALDAGASWLGVSFLAEALQLRAAGFTVPVLCWLPDPGEPLEEALAAHVDLSASAPWAVEAAVAAARASGVPARLHLKVDTGLHRAGATAETWGALVATAARAAATGAVEVVGVWSHLAYADSPRHPTTDAQLEAFRAALGVAERAGLRPQVRHLANSAATLTRPDLHFDLVRPGLACYGLSPVPEIATAAELGLRPAMTLSSRVALVKDVPAGAGVSYAHRYRTVAPTRLALVPAGYADGVPRAGGNVLPVWLAGARRVIAGAVCMDQFVVDVGDADVGVGDEVVLFGSGAHGEPTAQDWARALGTISYEIVTRLGARVRRRVVGAEGPRMVTW